MTGNLNTLTFLFRFAGFLSTSIISPRSTGSSSSEELSEGSAVSSLSKGSQSESSRFDLLVLDWAVWYFRLGVGGVGSWTCPSCRAWVVWLSCSDRTTSYVVMTTSFAFKVLISVFFSVEKCSVLINTCRLHVLYYHDRWAHRDPRLIVWFRWTNASAKRQGRRPFKRIKSGQYSISNLRTVSDSHFCLTGT